MDVSEAQNPGRQFGAAPTAAPSALREEVPWQQPAAERPKRPLGLVVYDFMQQNPASNFCSGGPKAPDLPTLPKAAVFSAANYWLQTVGRRADQRDATDPREILCGDSRRASDDRPVLVFDDLLAFRTTAPCRNAHLRPDVPRDVRPFFWWRHALPACRVAASCDRRCHVVAKTPCGTLPARRRCGDKGECRHASNTSTVCRRLCSIQDRSRVHRQRAVGFRSRAGSAEASPQAGREAERQDRHGDHALKALGNQGGSQTR